jgi:hypothetical protein
VLALHELFSVFRRDLTEPPLKVLKGAGEINIGAMQTIGAQADPPVAITVEEDPQPDNPAHAEIPQKLSKGVSRRIVELWTWHPAD